MLTPRANVHHSRLPTPGAVGHIVGLSTIDPQRKCIVSHYPLCDNVLPYSIGIHTVYVRFLDNREELCVSGIWFREALP
jgi:hypothetical protein